MKKHKIIYWSTVILFFLFEGVMPLFTFNTEMAKEGIRHLGYPEYFGVMLMVFKVLGAIALLLPMVPKWIKEWAYTGFAIDFISAGISYWAVEGFSGHVVFPWLFFIVLVFSYLSFHKLNDKGTAQQNFS